MGVPWNAKILRFLSGKERKYGEGGIIQPSLEEIRKRLDFKVEKVYEFKKGGRYFFVITTDRPITNEMDEALKETIKANNKRIMKELGIISSFLLLDNGLDIKVVPSGEVNKK